jgi:gas vesicle protein
MCEKCNQNNTQSFINGALMGAVVGAVLGVLYAPNRGQETRQKLRSSGEQYLDKTKDLMEDMQYTLHKVEKNLEGFKEKAAPVVSEVEERVVPVLKEIQTASEPVKQEIMEKIGQLVDEAEEKIHKDKKSRRKRFFDGV